MCFLFRSLSLAGTNSKLQIKHEREQEAKQELFKGGRIDRLLSSKISGMLSSQVLRVFRLAYDGVDRLILIFAFVAITTGIVTYGGLFVSLSFVAQKRILN